jgi:hypothetical protein
MPDIEDHAPPAHGYLIWATSAEAAEQQALALCQEPSS